MNTTGARGRWARRGSTIVIELPEKSAPEDLPFELETSQPTLRRGSSGSAVKTLQARLQTLGFNPGPIDGIFGSGTDAAVRAFQRARGIEVGLVLIPDVVAESRRAFAVEHHQFRQSGQAANEKSPSEVTQR